jgi:hypothetical protein
MRMLALTIALLFTAVNGTAIATYYCDSTHCNCDGTADCRDMRKSGMCKDDVLSCRGSPPYCTCDAARRLLGGSRVTNPPQRSPGTVK